MEKKLTYAEMMERVHNTQRAGVKLHGFMLDLAIDEALDALQQSRDDGNADAVKEVRA